ncbi:MAG TPA: hypothetical protein DCS30_05845 [Rhizobiales bacterium]|nr:hypothetical protein [Hyphomicrobiales bacterium]
MKSIYTWDAQPAKRNLTAADILADKGQRKLVQTTANNEEEAASAADAGLDMIMGNAHNTEAIRKGAPHLFFTAALGLPDFPTESDILKAILPTKKAHRLRRQSGNNSSKDWIAFPPHNDKRGREINSLSQP